MAKRRFRMVGTSLWNSQRFLSLPDDDCRYTYIYILTSPHCPSIGAYRLPPSYLSADLRITVTAATRRLKEIAKVGLIIYDFKEEMVALSNWFEFNSIDSRKHLSAALSLTRELPPKSNLTTNVLLGVANSMIERTSNWSDRDAVNGAAKMLIEAILEHRNIIGVESWETTFLSSPAPLQKRLIEALPIGLPIGVSIGVSPIETETETERERETESEIDTEIETGKKPKKSFKKEIDAMHTRAGKVAKK